MMQLLTLTFNFTSYVAISILTGACLLPERAPVFSEDRFLVQSCPPHCEGFGGVRAGVMHRSNFDVRTCGASVLPVEQPVWLNETCELGSFCFSEQRYWHAELHEDGRSQRTKEHNRGLRQRLSLMYELDSTHISRPTDSPDVPKTVLLNTKALVAWQLHKYNSYHGMGREHSGFDRGHAKAIDMNALLRRVFTQAARGAKVLGESDQLPRIDAGGGVVLQLRGDGRVDLRAFATACDEDELARQWDHIQAVDRELGLSDFDAEDALLSDFFLFVDRLCRLTGTQAGDWFWQLRVALLRAIAFLAELAISHQLAADDKAGRLRVPHVLLGPKKQRRQKYMILSKIDVQRKICEDGSSATQAAALGLSRGMAATVQFIQNEHYSRASRQHMKGVTSYCINWDQSTHGGYDMNVGFALDSNSKKGCYLRPAASHRPSVGSPLGGRVGGMTIVQKHIMAFIAGPMGRLENT